MTIAPYHCRSRNRLTLAVHDLPFQGPAASEAQIGKLQWLTQCWPRPGSLSRYITIGADHGLIFAVGIEGFRSPKMSFLIGPHNTRESNTGFRDRAQVERQRLRGNYS